MVIQTRCMTSDSSQLAFVEASGLRREDAGASEAAAARRSILRSRRGVRGLGSTSIDSTGDIDGDINGILMG